VVVAVHGQHGFTTFRWIEHRRETA